MGVAIKFGQASLSASNRELIEDAKTEALAYANAKAKKKAKRNSARKPKVSTEYEGELNKLSDISLDGVETNLDLLKAMRRTLLSTLNTARGAVRANPMPGNMYALARITNDVLTLTKAIEDGLDYSALSDEVFESVLKPFLDRALLDLGSHIHDALEKHGGDNEKRYKAMEKAMTEAYRKFGASLEGKIPAVQAKLKKTILTATK